jgi:linoleoyl-CoA desaturase
LCQAFKSVGFKFLSILDILEFATKLNYVCGVVVLITKFNPLFYTNFMLRFKSTSDFQKEVRKRVRAYLKEEGKSGMADYRYFLKAFLNMAMYLVPFILFLTGYTSFWMTTLLWTITGLGMAGVGMNVMHDAIHNNVTKSEWVNRKIGAVIYMLCGNSYTWKVQHNIKHHTHTNIDGHDDDIDTGSLFRFHPSQERKSHHRFQHIYAPFSYTLMTWKWLLEKDFTQVVKYNKSELFKAKDQSLASVWTKLIVGKGFHMSLFYILPIALGIPWYMVLWGNMVMHVVAGFILSLTFQLAHVVDKADFPTEDEAQERSLLEHQLKTTANFSTKNKLVTWYTGGLNFQVEHHMFPTVNHIHYPKIADIVRKTAEEFKLPYNEYGTTLEAIRGHFAHLKHMGRAMA